LTYIVSIFDSYERKILKLTRLGSELLPSLPFMGKNQDVASLLRNTRR